MEHGKDSAHLSCSCLRRFSFDCQRVTLAVAALWVTPYGHPIIRKSKQTHPTPAAQRLTIIEQLVPYRMCPPHGRTARRHVHKGTCDRAHFFLIFPRPAVVLDRQSEKNKSWKFTGRGLCSSHISFSLWQSQVTPRPFRSWSDPLAFQSLARVRSSFCLQHKSTHSFYS
jgi:hypothetical protein